MLDIGWTEILVIAIVLIVVVGPKDLPPMLRAFGKMTKRLRTMAGDFRQQFDEALREAELDDVRKTLSDAQRLNPVNSLKDALNPLRQMGNDIRNDLQNATRTDTATVAEPWTPGEPVAKLPDEPPIFPPADPAPAVDAKSAETPASRDAASTTSSVTPPASSKPVRKPRAPKPDASAQKSAVAEPTPAKPKSKRAPKADVSAETATAETAMAKSAIEPSARKTSAPARKTVATATETLKASPARQKKPAAAKTKKTGDA